MRFIGACYRFHDPRWAHRPLSGAGAALYGARFNPPGRPTLYLALTIETAVLEISQGFPFKLPPSTLVQYDVDCDDLADLRDDAGRDAAGASMAMLGCAWKAPPRGERPASWVLSERLIASGVAGILVPSFAPGAGAPHANLVQWDWGSDGRHRVAAFDPQRRLPRDQRSWDDR